jgi:hypothetical protein
MIIWDTTNLIVRAYLTVLYAPNNTTALDTSKRTHLLIISLGFAKKEVRDWKIRDHTKHYDSFSGLKLGL